MPYEEDAAEAEVDFWLKSGLPYYALVRWMAQTYQYLNPKRSMVIHNIYFFQLPIFENKIFSGSSTIFFQNKYQKFSIVLFIVVDANGLIRYYDINHPGVHLI